METNESLLTGESDPVLKQNGDTLYSGSFITSGKGICKVIHVGDDNYMNQITQEAKRLKKHNSELNRCLNKILKYVSIVILPIGGLLFLKQFFYGNQTFNSSIVSTVAAILGMIPEGLVLLTSVALTLSVLRLAKQNTLVQELFCIETLARVDVLCLDKTGTITEGTMKVEFDVKMSNVDISEIVGNLMHSLTDVNVTAQALKEHYQTKTNFNPYFVIPFSSDRKYSGTSYFNRGTYYIGAYQFLFPKGNEELEEKCVDYASEGYRILVLAHTDEVMSNEALPVDLEPLGIIVLSDVIRKDAKETLAYFNEQGVDLKVISGDDPITVSSIAKRAGLNNAHHYVDATTLSTSEEIAEALNKYSVFGRVTPQQKKAMVVALKQQGHTVAMTGDGVNDVLAFKEADCSIAMASGSEAAAQASQIVLLESDFSCMPQVVLEGRRVVNNIQRSASLFLVKNIFSFLLSLFSVVFMFTYPLEPSQVSLISLFTIGIPAFFLALEPNKNIIKGHFLTNVFLKALPAALTDALAVGALVVFGKTFGVGEQDISTAATMLLAIVGFMILYKISAPMNKLRAGILGGCIAGLLFCSIYLNQLFAITGMTTKCIMLFVVFAIATEPVLRYLTILLGKGRFYYRRLRGKTSLEEEA